MSPRLPGKVPRSFFEHHDSHPVVLDMVLLRLFGVDWLTWESPILWEAIEGVTGSPCSSHTKHKVQACRALHLTEDPWEEWQVFEKVIQALNNNIPDFRVMQAATPAQLWAGLDTMERIRDDVEFSDEVIRYIAACMLNSEVWLCPGPLEVAQSVVSQPRYEYTGSGYTGNVVFHSDPEELKPILDMFVDARSINHPAEHDKVSVETYLKHDPSDVERVWSRIKDKPSQSVHLGGTYADIQAAKLLVARDYVDMRNSQMKDQMKWL